jgi:hypothetical protein
VRALGLRGVAVDSPVFPKTSSLRPLTFRFTCATCGFRAQAISLCAAWDFAYVWLLYRFGFLVLCCSSSQYVFLRASRVLRARECAYRVLGLDHRVQALLQLILDAGVPDGVVVGLRPESPNAVTSLTP